MLGGPKSQGHNPIANLMETFAGYMGVPGSRPLGTTPETQTGPMAMRQRVRQMTRGLLRRGFRAARPVIRNIGRIVPRGIRNRVAATATRLGTQAARFTGAGAGTAARFGAAAGSAAPAALAVGGVAIGLVALIATVQAVIASLNKMKEAALANVQRLSQYNGLLAAGQSQLEIGRELRAIREAQAIGPAGQRLAEAQNRLENAQSPWRDMSASITTSIAAGWANVQATVFEWGNSVVERILTNLASGFEMIPDHLDGNIEEWIRKNAAAFKNLNGNNMAWQDWKTAMVEADQDFANRMKGPRKPGGAGP